MTIHTLTIVGVGLIGGSMGLAAKKRKLAQRLRGVGRSRDSLERALAVGAVDEAFLDLQPAVTGAELVVFATPVDRIVEQVLTSARWCSPGTLLTDAGSTKGRIVAEVEGQLPPGILFVGSHPLAGSEKRGPEHADADLFHKRWTVITPTSRTDAAAVERTRAFWQALGARVRLMAPDEHDRALALTSHLPHLAAAALAGVLLTGQDLTGQDPAALAELAASGFRDTTRVAAGDPELWTAIFAHNQDAVRHALALLAERLSQFRQVLDAGDWTSLGSLLAQAKKVRDALGN